MKKLLPYGQSMFRHIDNWLGKLEVCVCLVALCCLIVVASAQAIARNVFGISWLFTTEFVRSTVFIIAMTSAAYAAHKEELIAMDIASRLLPPWARPYLQAALRVFVGCICIVLAVHSWPIAQARRGEHYELLPSSWIASFLPIAAGMIAVHMLLHLVCPLQKDTEPTSNSQVIDQASDQSTGPNIDRNTAQ